MTIDVSGKKQSGSGASIYCNKSLHTAGIKLPLREGLVLERLIKEEGKGNRRRGSSKMNGYK